MDSGVAHIMVRTTPLATTSYKALVVQRTPLAAEFARYWQTQGGLTRYGYPISEAFQAVSATDGQPYRVQYFERSRLEYHPTAAAPWQVSGGLLGVEQLRAQGWLPGPAPGPASGTTPRRRAPPRPVRATRPPWRQVGLCPG